VSIVNMHGARQGGGAVEVAAMDPLPQAEEAQVFLTFKKKGVGCPFLSAYRKGKKCFLHRSGISWHCVNSGGSSTMTL